MVVGCSSARLGPRVPGAPSQRRLRKGEAAGEHQHAFRGSKLAASHRYHAIWPARLTSIPCSRSSCFASSGLSAGVAVAPDYGMGIKRRIWKLERETDGPEEGVRGIPIVVDDLPDLRALRRNVAQLAGDVGEGDDREDRRDDQGLGKAETCGGSTIHVVAALHGGIQPVFVQISCRARELRKPPFLSGVPFRSPAKR